MMFLWGIIAIAALGGLAVGGFFLANALKFNAAIGAVIGFIVGIIIVVLINVFFTNRIKAGQIAMMTKGINGEELEGHIYRQGIDEVKNRFGAITAFFFITSAIKGSFRQIGRAFTGVGQAVGGNVGGSVTGAIDSGIQAVISYLCDCCLGWVLFQKDKNAARAACEGAVIFFKNGKTLFRNVGRIIGMGIASFIVFGGLFTGAFYLIFSSMPNAFNNFAVELSKLTESDLSNNVPIFILVCSLIAAVFLWAVLHNVIVRPFILVGVLRNFMEAGQKYTPKESDFNLLESKSNKFAKLRNSEI